MLRLLLLVVVVVLAAAGCFGGGGTADAPPTPGPTPTRGAVSNDDRGYARTVCSAFGRYLTAFGSETQKDPQLFSDERKLLRVATPILDTLATDLDKAKPPKDVANFHSVLVERVGVIVKKAREGQLVSTQELSNISKGAPLPPQTVRERLGEAASNLPECAQSGGMDALFGAPPE